MKNILKMIISSIIITSLLVGSTLIFHAESYSIKAYMDTAFVALEGGNLSNAATVAARNYMNYINNATYAFQHKWGASFTIDGYYPFSANTLPWESCPYGYSTQCNNSNQLCGNTCVNEITSPTNHHKNGFRNWNTFKNVSYKYNNTFCVWATSANICYNKNNSHSATLGGLHGNGYIMIHSGTRSDTTSNPARLLQHEMSHYFGLSDGDCSSQLCIMKYDYYGNIDYTRTNLWCNSCLEKLNQYFNN